MILRNRLLWAHPPSWDADGFAVATFCFASRWLDPRHSPVPTIPRRSSRIGSFRSSSRRTRRAAARCHLAAVDLKDYILPSAKDTFLALRDQGLINLDKPEKSKILALINRGADDPKAAGLISAKSKRPSTRHSRRGSRRVRPIPQLRNAPKPAKAPALAVKPVEMVRHARKDRMVESFETNIWPMRFRCMNCHSEGTPQNDKLKKEYGERVAWFKKAGPEATMDYLLASKLIDLKNPEKSLLLTKPLNTVKHEGGVKFVVGDQGYKAFRAWIDDVVAIKTGTYAKAADLPAKDVGAKAIRDRPVAEAGENTGRVGRQTASGQYVRVGHEGRMPGRRNRSRHPTALSGERASCGSTRSRYLHSLAAIARRPGPTAGPSLPPGKYLVKVYVDAIEKVKTDWKAALGPDEFVGQVEIQSRWAEGYGAMTVADGTRVKK